MGFTAGAAFAALAIPLPWHEASVQRRAGRDRSASQVTRPTAVATPVQPALHSTRKCVRSPRTGQHPKVRHGGRMGFRLDVFRYPVLMDYQSMTIAKLAALVAGERDFNVRWRLVAEFLREYHQEPAEERQRLLAEAPETTGDERWDVLFAGLAEHLAMRDGKDAPQWSASSGLRRFWFPFDTPGARAQALVHASAAFRRRGVFVADYEIDAA